MRKALLFTLAFVFMLSGLAIAQNRTIKGTVTDAGDGSPLPGVNVVVKGTTTGTVTDMDGKYQLQVSEGVTLVFSYIGYQPQEIAVAAQSVIDVSLGVDATALEEVVVTGYGEADKKKISAAVATVKSETISQVPNASLDQVLQGQAPGLNIQSSTGQPGASGTILLRGRSSINGNVEPLFIIDGVPVDENNFRSLNANDIENVSILKDASASALYGNRGANGVIVVTTKKGKLNSGVKIQYRGQYGVSQLIDPNVDFMNSQQILEAQREIGTGVGDGMTDAEIAALAQTNTNWREIFFRDAEMQSHELNVTAGTSNTRSYTSLAFLSQEGITRRSVLERFTFRNNLSTTYKDRLSITTNFTANYSTNSFPEDEGTGQLDNPFLSPYLSLPFYDPYNEDGSLNLRGTPESTANFTNTNGFLNTPFITLSSNTLDTQEEEEFKSVGNVSLDYTIFDGLNIGGSLGYDYTQINNLRIINPISIRGEITPAPTATIKGSQFESLSRDFTLNTNAFVSYFKELGKHSFTVSAYTEFYNRRRENNGFSAFGIDPKLIGSGAGLTDGATTDTDDDGNPVYNYIPNVFSTTNEIATFSYFGVLQYDYEGRFGGQLSIRRDRSSRFSETNQWGTFWSVSARWNITEDFFTTSDNVNNLKLRLSYGTAGNSRVFGTVFGGAFAAYDLYSRGNGYLNAPAYFPSQIGNPDLSWEVVTQANVGLDFGFFKNKLTGTLDVYNKVTDDVFLSRPLSLTSGFRSLASNVGQMTNRGVELGLNYTAVETKDLRVSANVNFAYNRTTIDRLAGDDFIEQGRTALSVGDRFGSFFLVRTAGINPANGKPLYLDADGNLTENFSNENRVLLDKSRDPLYTGGFGFNVQYKGFSINTLFSYALEQYRNNGSLGVVMDPGLAGFANQSTALLDSWKQPGDITEVPALAYGATRLQLDDRFLQNSSFVRLRNLTIAYNFNSSWLESTKTFSGARIYLQGQNLFTFTEWQGFDPESDLAGSFFEFPAPRVFTVGLDLTF